MDWLFSTTPDGFIAAQPTKWYGHQSSNTRRDIAMGKAIN